MLSRRSCGKTSGVLRAAALDHGRKLVRRGSVALNTAQDSKGHTRTGAVTCAAEFRGEKRYPLFSTLLDMRASITRKRRYPLQCGSCAVNGHEEIVKACTAHLDLKDLKDLQGYRLAVQPRR